MFFEKEKPKKFHKNIRNTVIVLLIAAILLGYVLRLAQIQIADHDYYVNQANLQTAQTVVIKAPRGEILDRYGRAIAVNRDGYNIVFDASYISMEQINATIMKLVTLLRQNEDEWRDELPIDYKFPCNFVEDADSSASTLKKELGLNHYATAQNCYNTMVEKYNLGNYSQTNQRIIMGIRYTMDLEDFSVSYPYTFAEDISEKTRTKILESAAALPGIKIEETAIRDYPAGDVAAQIIGTTGPIYAEDWEKLKDKGYSYNDIVGKSGAELAFEDYLRGTNGEKKIIKDADGNVIEEIVTKEPVPGNTVMLSIDLSIQSVASESLQTVIKDLQSQKINATTGSVVAINVNSGEVIASANCPTYTLDEYQNNYTALVSDPANPLFDRAFNGTYPPGSTFKPGIAAIGLTTGKITGDETIYCKQQYTYYSDMTFRCLGYHGSTTVVEALSVSCNYFFFETGRRIGINVMNSYCQLMGLGVRTGVELPESAGTLAGPAYTNSINASWYPGDTLQAAIGQSYNLFTPLQLATYTATIANGGTRYNSHLLYQVKSHDLSETIVDNTSYVAAETGFTANAIDVVKQGMLSAAFEGTASSVFGNYSIEVGGKTGTAETIGENNGVFISFAPYENSEIAVAIVIEHGIHGYLGAPIAKNIFDAYFFAENEKNSVQQVDQLL